MYLSILEYALVRLGVGALGLMLRAAELFLLVTMRGLGLVFRVVFRPVMRGVAGLVGSLWGRWLVANSRT